MADYIYLLQTRLTSAQLTALQRVRDIAREAGVTVFLVGGAVRDLTAGFSVHDLDFALQADPTKLKKAFQAAGFVITGDHAQTQTLFLSFPGGVRLEVGATLSATYPKPGKPVYAPAAILDDLRRRDFTANAMAISLNEGSFGLLMDPLNGVADLENMEFRLVSNYGFIEDPVRMIRAARLSARLGWRLEEKTQQRYETGKSEGYISALSPWLRGYETEEIFHESDPVRILRRLESEGWMQVLFPALTAAKANEAELSRLHDLVAQLQSAGIHPDVSAVQFPLVTAKLAPKDVAELKKLFPRQGFVAEIDALDGQAKAFAAEFAGKAAAVPSAAWRMLYAAPPEHVLAAGYSSKSAPVQARLKAFLNDWPQARQRIPYQAMQEMRITPDLPIYEELLDKLFFALMDAQLETPEAIKAFLEPYSPPAPPPPPSLRRRPAKRETKASKKKAPAAPVETPAEVTTKTLGAVVATEAPVPPPPPAKAAPAEKKPAPAKAAEKKAPAKAPEKKSAAKTPAKVPAKKPAPVAKKAAKPAPPAKKAAPKKAAAPAKKAAKPAPKKTASKAASKKAAKAAPKKAPAKKPTPKPVKKAPAKKLPAKKVAAKKQPAKAAKKSARKR